MRLPPARPALAPSSLAAGRADGLPRRPARRRTGPPLPTPDEHGRTPAAGRSPTSDRPGSPTRPRAAGLARYTAQPAATGSPAERQRSVRHGVGPRWTTPTPDGAGADPGAGQLPATAPAARGLFINPGGPGGSGLDFVRRLPARRAGGLRPGRLGSARGRTTPPRCTCSAPTWTASTRSTCSPDDAGRESELLTEAEPSARPAWPGPGSCSSTSPPPRPSATSTCCGGWSGDARLNYLGFSYGTQIGCAVRPALSPARRAGWCWTARSTSAASRAVEPDPGLRTGARTTSRPGARGRRCGLGAERMEVLATVSACSPSSTSSPLTVGQPRAQPAAGGAGGAQRAVRRRRRLGRAGAASSIRRVAGDGRALLALADRATSAPANGRYGQIAYAFPAIRCRDSQRRRRRRSGARGGGGHRRRRCSGRSTGPTCCARCGRWRPVRRAPKITAPGRRPIVVVGTTGDPATPYEYAVGMASSSTRRCW